MRIRNIAITGLALSLAMSSAAFAGETSLSNTITRRTTEGTSYVKANVSSYVDGVKVTTQEALKIDAVGENAGAFLSFSGGEFKGSGFATNVENPDPFVSANYTSVSDVNTYGSSTEAVAREESTYTEKSITYTLTGAY